MVADANADLSGSTSSGSTGTVSGGLSTISGSSGTAYATGPVLIYRRDLTDAGWPMDPEIRRALRRGELPQQADNNTGAAASGGRLKFSP